MRPIKGGWIECRIEDCGCRAFWYDDVIRAMAEIPCANCGDPIPADDRWAGHCTLACLVEGRWAEQEN